MRNLYNERLFNGGIRKWFHTARFRWLKKKCIQHKVSLDFVIEIGCFDARSLDFFPEAPKEYYGFDAGWEGGLELARVKYAGKNWRFLDATKADDINLPDGQFASLAISLETLEHIAPELIDEYLKKTASLLDGYFLVTVPNEKGVVFLMKYLAKLLFFTDAKKYKPSEIYGATFGLMHMVGRREHKGFDWEEMRDQLSQYFDVIDLEGVQFPMLPASLNPQIGFVMASKNRKR